MLLTQGTAVYMPAGWIFLERVTSIVHWIGIKAGVLCSGLQTLNHLKWLASDWAKDDEVVKLMMACVERALSAEPAASVLLDSASKAEEDSKQKETAASEQQKKEEEDRKQKEAAALEQQKKEEEERKAKEAAALEQQKGREG